MPAISGFKRIRVPGEESVDLAVVLDAAVGGDWRKGIGLTR